MKDKRVVITGIGIISSLGFTVRDYWKNRWENNTGIDFLENLDTRPYEAKKGGEVKNFNPQAYIKRKNIRALDQITRYCIAGVAQAITDASVTLDEINRKEIGLVIGSMYHGIGNIFKLKESFHKDGILGVNPLYFPGTVFNAPAGQTAIEYGLQGINSTVNLGTASGLLAVIKGMDYLLTDIAQIIIVGGAEMLHEYIFAKYNNLGYLSIEEKGGEQCRPFDKERNGIILGEGACFFVLETSENAKKRGAKIYGQIEGYGNNYCSQKERAKEAIISCMQSTLEASHYTPDDISLIVSDGSGNEIQDRVEARSIGTLFSKTSPEITANKGNLGHTLGASGAFNLLDGLLSIHKDEIPAIRNFNSSEFNLNFTKNHKKKKLNKVLINSIDDNGNNACIGLGKWEDA